MDLLEGLSELPVWTGGASRSVHDLRTRFSGDRTFVEYHLEVDGRSTVQRAHEIADATEAAVKSALPGEVEATAHLEPYGINDERLDHRVKSSPIE